MSSSFRQILLQKIANSNGILTQFVNQHLPSRHSFKELFLTTPPGPEREKLILNEVLKRGLPTTLVPVTITGPNNIKITYKVMPDYLMLDGLRITMAPATAQKIANHFNMKLPTDKMSQQIYQAADTKVRATPLSSSGYTGPNGKFYSPEEVVQHRINQSDAAIEYNKLTDQELDKIRQSGKIPSLIAGHGKDILQPSAPEDPRIGGWAGLEGQPLQPYSTAHKGQAMGHTEYGLYTRLVDNQVTVTLPDGRTVETSLDKILNNPTISKALSSSSNETKYRID